LNKGALFCGGEFFSCFGGQFRLVLHGPHFAVGFAHLAGDDIHGIAEGLAPFVAEIQ